MDKKLLSKSNQMLLLSLQQTMNARQSQQVLEEELLDLKMQNAELNEYVYTVAHQLKNPLNSVIGFSSLIDRYYDQMSSANLLENVRATIQIGRNMTSMIDGLLMLAKMNHAPEFNPEMGSLDMHAIIERVTLNLNQSIRECNAHIYLPDDWFIAKGYSPWVEEIWMNYISNAIKYGGSPPVIRLGSDMLDNRYIHFWVQDNGQGLSSDEKQKIFHPFTRLRKQEIDGNGLGLTVVKKIVERLEGTISLESDVSRGSRFGFTLPVARLVHEDEPVLMNEYHSDRQKSETIS